MEIGEGELTELMETMEESENEVVLHCSEQSDTCHTLFDRRFGEGELTELMEIMEESENEVDRRLTNPLREYLWWLSTVSAFCQYCVVSI